MMGNWMSCFEGTLQSVCGARYGRLRFRNGFDVYRVGRLETRELAAAVSGAAIKALIGGSGLVSGFGSR